MKETIIKRVKKLCEKKINAKNLFKAINKHAISVISYHVGVVNIKSEELKTLDDDIKKILIKKGMHLQPSNNERLYIPRSN